MTLGAGVHSINVPDRNGNLGDVVLGFDDVNDYVNPDLGYQGLAVGRYANRIRDAKFSIDGVEYNTPKNQGTWTLHGGGRFSFNIWDVKEVGDNFVTFSFFSPDMQDGFPGNFTMTVKYTFQTKMCLKLNTLFYLIKRQLQTLQIIHILTFRQTVQKLLRMNICK